MDSFKLIYMYCSSNHLSRPWSINWVALSFLCCCSSCYGDIRPNLHFFNIYRHKSLVLTQFHLIPSSTDLYWPSTTKYQTVPRHTDPTPSNINQCRLQLTQDYHVSISSASYWPSNIIYQPVLPYTDPVPQNTNQYRPNLTQYHPLSTWYEHSCVLV